MNKKEIAESAYAYRNMQGILIEDKIYFIQSWLKDKDELKIIADTVQKVSYIIINKLAESSDSAFSDLKEDED